MTFKINNVDYSTYLTKYGYSTSYTPVFADSVTTLDGVEHTAVIRYRGTLTVTLRPMTATEWATFSAALAGILSITYTNIQKGTDVTVNMRMDEYSANLVLINTSRTLFGDTQLTFVEL